MPTTYLLSFLPKSARQSQGIPVVESIVEKMAPVDIHNSPSKLPLAVLILHAYLVLHFSALVGRTIYRSYLALPPSSATRSRQPLRKSHVRIFALLILASLVPAAYFGWSFASLSYRTWATERGVELPDSWFGDNGGLRNGEHPGRIHFARWLNDTPFYQDALEIIAEKSRYFWWSQQINLGLVSWSVYLAVEGRRRNIDHLFGFSALAQLVNLSYAQNLFFLTVLLTPVSLPENVKEYTTGSLSSNWLSRVCEKIVSLKPNGFLLNAKLYINLLLANFAAVFLIPFASNTPSFMTVSLVSRLLPFSFLILPRIIPLSWGKTNSHHHDAQDNYTTLFRTISAVSVLLHLKSTLITLFTYTPESQYYRHSLLHPFKQEHRSAFVRGSTALSRLFGVFKEHPAISATFWDVIISGLSLGVWAAIRGLDATEMLRSSIPFLSRSGSRIKELTKDLKFEETPQKVEQASTTRARGRPKRSEISPKLEDDEAIVVAGPRRRDRPSKKPLPEIVDSEASYEPTESDRVEEGDEKAQEDWEVGALTWGLITASGLGLGSASVFGPEVLAR